MYLVHPNRNMPYNHLYLEKTSIKTWHTIWVKFYYELTSIEYKGKVVEHVPGTLLSVKWV